MFETLLKPEYGWLGVCTILLLQVLIKGGELLFKKKHDSDVALISEVKKLRKDLRRFYTAIKLLAGEKWPEIRKELMEEDDLDI